MSVIRRLAAPLCEPITLAEAKKHCRVTSGADDVLFGTLIPAARLEAENVVQRTLCPTAWRLSLDGFQRKISLPYPQVQAVTAFQYRDLSGAWQPVDPALYGSDFESLPGQLYLKYDRMWPIADYDCQGSVRVDYVAGYSNPAGNDPAAIVAAQAAVPANIKAWILIRIATLYEHREQILAGMPVAEIPFVDGLLDGERIWSMR